MKTTKQRSCIHVVVFVIGCILILAAGSIQRAQQRQRHAVDANGAPLFKVDPFWPKPLPNRWGMQQVTGIFVDQNDHIWFLNRAAKGSPPLKENNQQTDILVSKGRFNLDEDAREIYIINWKRVLVYDMDTGAFKRGWGGHGMPLSEITNDPIPGYKWIGGPPPEEKNIVPDLHFAEFSKEGLVYIGERGQNRIEVFTKQGKFVREFYVSPNTPSRGEICGGLYHEKFPPCGTTSKLAFSRYSQQKYVYVADGTNDKIWILDRDSGKTLGGFGRNGTYAGQFHWINAIAMDSKGNIYTGEVEENKRIQKFVPVMANN